jgi:hypothetical protein
MKIEDLKTWDDLGEYLIERLDDCNDDKSKANSSFTKRDTWNMYYSQCQKYQGQDLPVRTIHILLKSIKKDFK